MRKEAINKPEEIRGVLLISLTGIGNTIFFTPVVRNVREIFPNAAIYFLGTPATIAVVSGSPYVDELIVYEKEKMGTIFSQLRFIGQLKRRHIDVAICAFSERSTVKFSMLTLLSGAKIRAGVNEKGRGVFFTHQTRPVNDRHEVEQNLDILRTITGQPLTSEIFFWVEEKDKLFAQKWISDAGIGRSHPVIGLHPGSAPGNPHKRWPLENYARLTSWLYEKHRADIIVFGGPEERALAESVAGNTPTVKIATGQLSLKQTAAILDYCDFFVGHDSGIMHLAAARGIPVIAMFGHTSPEVYGPYGDKHRVIVSDQSGIDAMKNISVEKIQQNTEVLMRMLK
ncbi:MAG: glycosyltransferase family 9 protein [Calditrichia bacterium]